LRGGEEEEEEDEEEEDDACCCCGGRALTTIPSVALPTPADGRMMLANKSGV
jgi:hypothetical protein